ncbi:hypothetical protein F5884DRAFT_789731 [Xylogone sp. PMI_703]|nr:hypothetical protein F5884DRAFT_789731 [Xylogone sp. PMI_703]
MASLDKISSEEQSSGSSSNIPTGTSQLEEQDKFEFLEELTSSSKHLNKSFYDHLFNVYTHLKESELPEEVCNAGLFHSIYGTEFYHFHNNRITRDVVRGYIGEYAEELVHIFCGLKKDRFQCIVNNSLGLSKGQHLDLCYVEFANLWDQKEHGRLEARLDILIKTIERLESSE